MAGFGQCVKRSRPACPAGLHGTGRPAASRLADERGQVVFRGAEAFPAEIAAVFQQAGDKVRHIDGPEAVRAGVVHARSSGLRAAGKDGLSPLRRDGFQTVHGPQQGPADGGS